MFFQLVYYASMNICLQDTIDIDISDLNFRDDDKSLHCTDFVFIFLLTESILSLLTDTCLLLSDGVGDVLFSQYFVLLY